MSIPYAELASLEPTMSFVVGDEHLDLNGHMNIIHYFGFGATAIWQRVMDDSGMDENYIGDYGHTTFTVEQHIQYFGECVKGDQIDVTTFMLARTDKALHLAALIANRTRQQLSSVLESVLIHVNFETRRPAPFGPQVAAALDQVIRADSVSWQLPLSGALGVRR